MLFLRGLQSPLFSPPRKKCNAEGCTNVAVQGGKCKSHGVPNPKCVVPGCTNTSSSGGRCRRHRDFVMSTEKDCEQNQVGGFGAPAPFPSISSQLYAPASDDIARGALNYGFPSLVRSFFPPTADTYNSTSAAQNHELLQIAHSQNSLAAGMLSNFSMANTANGFMNPMAAVAATSSGSLMNPAMVMNPMAFNPMAAAMGMNFTPQAVASFGYRSQMNPSSALFGNGYLDLGCMGILGQRETNQLSNQRSLLRTLNGSEEVKSQSLPPVDGAEVNRNKCEDFSPTKEW